MSERKIAPYSQKYLTIAKDQKIAIGTYGGGITTVFYKVDTQRFPAAYRIQRRIENEQIILGPFDAEKQILIRSTKSGVFYEVGDNPAISSDILPSGFGALSGHRNKIINGKMDIWQRGTSFSFTGTDAYSADRFLSNRSGANLDISQQAFTPGQIDVPCEPEFFMRCEATSSDDLWGVVQRIEGVRTLANSVVTFSFYAKADDNYPLRIAMAQDFGIGGSSDVTLADTENTLTTSWKRYSFTTTLGSMSGKTINADNFLSCQVLINENTTGVLDTVLWQFEPGPVATDFEERLNDLALCQRYCWQGKSVASGNAYLYGGAGNANMYCSGASFPVTMRKSPTMSIVTAPTYNNCTNFDLSASENGYAHRVDVIAAGRYRAYNGVYLAEAEI